MTPGEPVRAIIFGSRSWDFRDPIHKALDSLPFGSTVVHGRAFRGADRIAHDYVVLCNGRQPGRFIEEPHPAEWDKHGKAAGIRRNAEMAALGADIAFGFREVGHSPGTDDMHRRVVAKDIVCVYLQAEGE